MSNSEVMRFVSDRFDVTLSSLFRKFDYRGPGTGKDLPGRCNWNTRNQSGRFNRENGTTFWAVPLFLGIFQSGEPEKTFFI